MKIHFQIASFFTLVVVSFLLFSCGGKSSETTNQTNADSTAVSQKSEQKLILFFGNSLTAGYGIDPEDAFPGLTQAAIDSLGKDYKVINGGLSGETTAGGLSRLDWFLEEEPYLYVS